MSNMDYFNSLDELDGSGVFPLKTGKESKDIHRHFEELQAFIGWRIPEAFKVSANGNIDVSFDGFLASYYEGLGLVRLLNFNIALDNEEGIDLNLNVKKMAERCSYINNELGTYNYLPFGEGMLSQAEDGKVPGVIAIKADKGSIWFLPYEESSREIIGDNFEDYFSRLKLEFFG